MKKTILALVFLTSILYLSCSGSKDFDEKPTPIGGDNRVRTVFRSELGSRYNDFKGKRISFLISIHRDGAIESISVNRGINVYIDKALEKAMQKHVRFTPAIKNNKKVKVQFIYSFMF